MQKSITASYLLFLGAIIGMEFASGALIAPIIFYPSAYIGEGVLSHFQSGQLMTQVFLRLNIILMVFAISAWIYEAYMIKLGKKDNYTLIFMALISLCIYLFVFYYTPYILEAQKLGAEATKTAEFASYHKNSELVMKALMMLQIALLFRRVWILLDKK